MGKIVVHEFMTLDGVIENPSWSRDYGYDPKLGAAIGQIMQGSTALLLRRNTYEMFAPAWSTRTADEDPGAPFMNESPKYVVSSTLKSAEWNNSMILGPYSVVRAMLADGLADELHLFVYPLVLGAGLRLFEDGLRANFTLGANETYDNGALHLTYQPAK